MSPRTSSSSAPSGVTRGKARSSTCSPACAGRGALPGGAQRRPHARHRRSQDRAPPDPVGHPPPCGDLLHRQRRRPVAAGAAGGDGRARPRRRRAGGPSPDLGSLSAHPALPRCARRGARGGAGGRQDRHHRPRHRPGLRGQGRPPRDPAAGSAGPGPLCRQARGAARLPQLRAHAASARERRRFRPHPRRSARDGGASRPDDHRRAARPLRSQSPGPEPAVRGRARRAARHRSRHLPVRHLEQLRCGGGRGGGGRRSADAALRPRHYEGVHDARRVGAVPDRTRRRHRRAARARAATSSVPPPAGRAAAGGSTPRR